MKRNSISKELRKFIKFTISWAWRGYPQVAIVAGISDDEARQLRDRFFKTFKK